MPNSRITLPMAGAAGALVAATAVFGPALALNSIENYLGCAMQGLATKPDDIELNRLKNRYDVPVETQIDRTLTFADLAKAKKGAFTGDKAATIEGYIVEATDQGPESCNCKLAGAKVPRLRDVHIYLAPDNKTTAKEKAKCVIVEVSPRMRELLHMNTAWTGAEIRKAFGKNKVRVTGWLFYDSEHDHNSVAEGKPTSKAIWRASAWELHPITAIERA